MCLSIFCAKIKNVTTSFNGTERRKAQKGPQKESEFECEFTTNTNNLTSIV